MKPNTDLWRRLVAFDIDGEGHDGRFLSKLARDNGWHNSYAARVLEEYRRYAYLACTAGRVVVPSEQVDQAWHQHLLDTQPYWDEFCKGVLRRPLHHRPSKGGVEDRRRHVELYEQSLASYQQAFGHPPPCDIWPSAAERFGPDLRQRRVRLADYWLIPKRPLKRAAGTAATVAMAAVLIGAAPAYAAWVSPLDFTGPTFVAFYALLFALALIASLVLRRKLTEPTATAGAFSGGGAAREEELDPYEAATLNTSTRLAINAAVAALERDGALAIVEEGNGPRKSFRLHKGSRFRLVARGGVPFGARPLESAVYEQVLAAGSEGVAISGVHERAAPAAAAMVTSLRDRGLLHASVAGLRFAAALPLVVLAILGATKLAVGISRDRPVTFLVIALGVTAGAALLVTFAGSRRTRRGEAALRRAKARYATKPSKIGPNDVSGGTELAWMVALFGVAVLYGGPLGRVHAALAANASCGGGAGATSTGGCGGGCGGGSGGGSGDGGSGSGGGGCSGGGCGGCGGS